MERTTSTHLTKKDPDVILWFPGVLRPNLVDYIVYDQIDFSHVQVYIASCCPEDINTNSAALRNILREFGSDSIFQLRPIVGEVLTIQAQSSFIDNQNGHLLITRPSQRAPQITDDFFSCLEHLKASLLSNETPIIHLPIMDPEHPLRSSDNFYHGVMDVFTGNGITVILQDRVYVSITSIAQFPGITELYNLFFFVYLLFGFLIFFCLTRPSGSTRATGLCSLNIKSYAPLLFKGEGLSSTPDSFSCIFC